MGTRLRPAGYAGASTRPQLFSLFTEQERITTCRRQGLGGVGVVTGNLDVAFRVHEGNPRAVGDIAVGFSEGDRVLLILVNESRSIADADT